MKFAPKDPINNIPALIEVMARHRPGNKPLSEPMMIPLRMHICFNRPKWVKGISLIKKIYFSLTTNWISLTGNKCFSEQVIIGLVIGLTPFLQNAITSTRADSLLFELWSPVDSPHKEPTVQIFQIFLLLAWTCYWVNSWVASDLRCHNTYGTLLLCETLQAQHDKV